MSNTVRESSYIKQHLLQQIDNLKKDKICKKREQILESKQHINTKNTHEELIEIGFFTKYKSYILVIIILILICFIIFLIYRYYKKSNNKKDKPNLEEEVNKDVKNIKEDVKNSNENIESLENKKKEIQTYLSNYIIDEEIENNDIKNDFIENNKIENDNIDNNIIKEGTIINSNNGIILTDTIKVLSLYSSDKKENAKIIYNNHHLNLLIKNIKHNKIVLTSGCFDILHVGHLKTLKLAKELGDILIVCLSNDEQIKKLKGNNRPINSYIDRINLFKTIDYVDYIILYEETDILKEKSLDTIMKIVDPYVWVKGNDYIKEEILSLHPHLKRIELINMIENKSTTNIINQILK